MAKSQMKPGSAKTTSKHCRAKTKAGEPCKAPAAEGGLCAFHSDPKRAAQLGKLGGCKNRRYVGAVEVVPVRPPQTANEVKDLLANTLAGVYGGRLEPRIGSVVAYVSAALLKAVETTDLEQRVNALEQMYKKQ